jgi:guanylate kinase
MSGNLFIVSGPSGAGKDALLSKISHRLGSSWLSISATTRTPRINEQNGVHYYFLSDEEFDGLLAVDDLLEWATVHGKRYGTIRSNVEEHLKQGKNVILEIDPQGAMQVKSKMPEAIMIFIEPPSLEVLEKRLRGRGTEDESSMQCRLANATEEMKYRDRYDEVIINDDLEVAAEELYELISK